MDFNDDESMRVPLSTVSSDVDLFHRKEAKIGLQLVAGQCEVITKAEFNPERYITKFYTVLKSDAILLGAALLGLRTATDRALDVRYSGTLSCTNDYVLREGV